MKQAKFLLVLAVLCLFSQLTSYAWVFAGEGVIIDGIHYDVGSCRYDDGQVFEEAHVSSGGDYIGDIVIPSQVVYKNKTYPVRHISSEAFKNCTELTSISIPSSVNMIDGSAFKGCTGLASIVVDYSNPVYDSRNNCNAIVETESNTLIVVCKNTIIPNSVLAIGEGAYMGHTELTSFTIPNSIVTIGQNAFRDCTGLTSLTIPNSVSTIGIAAFMGCTGLTSITIPNSVSTIESSSFRDCTKLASITIPNSVTTIGGYAFKGCAMLASIIIPNSVSTIGEHTFEDCTKLESVSLPNSITEISQYAFKDCSSLTSITIPNFVTYIGDRAFYGCSLSSIIFPSSVTYIGKRAFSGCTFSLVTCYATNPPSLGDNNFADFTIPLYVPKGSVVKYKAAANWRNFVIIREIGEEQDVYLGIKQANGEVRMKVDNEKPYFSLQIKADEGWRVHSVMLNDEDVTAEMAADGSYTTPAINSNSTLYVTYEKGSSAIASTTASRMHVNAFEGRIAIRDAEAEEQITVYTTDGRMVASVAADAQGAADIALPENQTYIVRANTKTVKVRL